MPDMVLQLYVSRESAMSKRAIENIKEICEKTIPGKVDLEIIDVHQDPESAERAKILATPTLIRRLPPPLRRIIGDLSDRGVVEAVLASPSDAQQGNT